MSFEAIRIGVPLVAFIAAAVTIWLILRARPLEDIRYPAEHDDGSKDFR